MYHVDPVVLLVPSLSASALGNQVSMHYLIISPGPRLVCTIKLSPLRIPWRDIRLLSIYCENTFILWYQFLWFLQNALIHRFLNSWFQTLQKTVNGKIVFCWILIFMVKVNHEINQNYNPTINNDFLCICL
jgi:hypothetical protein